jgi:hypothetical protein
MHSYITTALIALVVVAIVFRVSALKSAITGMA